MKRLLIVFLLLGNAAIVHAQDLLTTRKGEDIQVKVLEVYPGFVRYKKFSNPDGPVYIIEKKNVLVIKYENGDKDVFEDSPLSQVPLFTPDCYCNMDTLETMAANRVTDALTPRHAQGNPAEEPSAKLEGRSVMGSLPFPVKDNIQKQGIVVVRIYVNREGTVTSAVAGEQGTTVTDKTLWDNAVAAAKKAKFNVSRNAPESQRGTITYDFH